MSDKSSGFDPAARPRFYGRRKGRTLSPTRRTVMQRILEKFGVNLQENVDKLLNPADLFSDTPTEIWLEIGFGAGEHMLAQATANPDVGYIGCEIFETGVGAACAAIDEAGIRNIRLVHDDARLLISSLRDNSLDRIFLLHPDPWPKNRHEGRRFVSQPHLDQFARLLKDGGELRISTDHMIYARWTMFQMFGRQDFQWQAGSARDWREPPSDWPETRYQRKAQEQGIQPVYLRYLRTPGQ